jgi:hypothetical protein
MTEYLFRYRDVAYAAGLDEYDEPIAGGGRLGVHLERYEIVKRTKKGAYACSTIEEAKESFRRRKLRQHGINQGRAERAKHMLDMIEANDLPDNEYQTRYYDHFKHTFRKGLL